MTAENNTIRLNTLDLQMERYMLTQDSSVSLYEAHKSRSLYIGAFLKAFHVKWCSPARNFKSIFRPNNYKKGLFQS